MKMRKYRKKAVEIEAIQWDGVNINEIKEFVKDNAIIEDKIGGSDNGENYLQRYIKIIIKTLEGDLIVKTGDWIIKGIKGEFYPCKPDIFEAIYEGIDNEKV
jgi:hypothetical protein